jgi:hypothetical protein
MTTTTMTATDLFDVDLSVGEIVSSAFRTGLQNTASLGVATVLWLLTIWVPYLNIGTTIAMLSVVAMLARGKTISPTEIFDPRYRKMMGEYFLLAGYQLAGTLAGIAMGVIPGIVISISWSQAVYLMLDRQINPVEALTLSNRITYGYKWRIFLGVFAVGAVYGVLFLVVWLLSRVSPVLGGLLALAWIICYVPVLLGAWAHIYHKLSGRLDGGIISPVAITEGQVVN